MSRYITTSSPLPDELTKWLEKTWCKDMGIPYKRRTDLKQEENMQMNEQDKIDYIMDHFDFERVYEAMLALDWQWKFNGVPEVCEMRQVARKLLKDAIKIGGAETGGFCARYHNNGDLTLNFVVEHEEFIQEEYLEGMYETNESNEIHDS